MLSYQFTLINYPPSVTTEKVRWVFRYYGVEVVEKRMTLSPGFLLAALRYFPRFRKGPPYAIDNDNGLYFRHPNEVIDYFDSRAAEGEKLRLAPQVQNAEEVIKIKQAIKLAGGHIRPWAYSYITPNKEMFLQSISAGAPESQKNFVRMTYPLIAYFTRNSLTPDSKKLPEHFKALSRAFDLVDALLADGRRFLQDGRLSDVDIYFCVHAAPCVMPPQYAGGGVLPEFDILPPEMKPLVKAFRQRPTGQYVLRVYEELRFK